MGTRSALGRTTATSEAASQESLCSGRTPPETSAAPASAWQTARRESPGVPSQDSRAANRRKNRQPLPRSFPRQFGSRLPPQDARSASAPPPAAPPRFLSPHPKASPSAPAHESPRRSDAPGTTASTPLLQASVSVSAPRSGWPRENTRA